MLSLLLPPSLTSVLLLLVAPALVASVNLAERATVCNGYSELCPRGYGNVTYVGAHNSYAVGSTNLATNQDYDLTRQLTDGIRLLQNQVHLSDGQLRLCHTDCLIYDGGLLSAYLGKLKTWLDANPNEVVTILFVNIDNQPAASFASVFTSAGLDSLAFAPPTPVLPSSQWPSLGTLIDSGKRLVIFLDNGASDAGTPWLIPEFGNIWETAFNVIDPAFGCAVNRSQGEVAEQMYLINHFLDKAQQILGASSLVPAKDQLNITNAESGFGSLGKQAEDCIAMHSRPPNFMLVDFYNYGEGSIFRVAANLNGVSPPTQRIAPPIINGSTSSTNGGSDGSGGRGSSHAMALNIHSLQSFLLLSTAASLLPLVL